jgi:hypothetical protein
MSNKYIPQIDNQNFVFPNYDLAEYDVNIIHNIDSYSVSGTVTNFTGITVTSTGMTFTHDWSWSKNGADTFISESGNIHLLSVHMLAAGQDYYKPWRCIDLVTNGVTTGSTYSGSNTITVTPAQMGLSQFAYGTYYFEFRFIGEKAIYPICYTYSATTIPTPTPTATPTPTPTITPTSTPFVTGPTPTATSVGPVTPTPTPLVLTTYTDCGRGTTIPATCFDATNSRTFYSNCASISFGIGCYVYIDTFGNPLTGYNFVFIAGSTWNINSSTGQITALAFEQC